MSPRCYSAAIDTPKNQAFVKAYCAKFGKVPGYYSENNYTTALWLDQAMKKEGGKYPGPEAFIRDHGEHQTRRRASPAVQLVYMRNPIERLHQEGREKKKMFGYEKDEPGTRL